jgi:ABC-type sulfate transport system substrate-binding protein
MGIRAHMLMARRRRMLMWWMLLAIIGCYAFAALAVRLAARHLPGWRAGMHVVLFAGNQGQRVEWYLRRLRWWSLRTGRDVRVTLVDCGSTDDTAAIAERFEAGVVTVVRSDELVGKQSGLSEDPAKLKESWQRRRSSMPSIASVGDGRGADGTLLINLNDPADVATLP